MLWGASHGTWVCSEWSIGLLKILIPSALGLSRSCGCQRPRLITLGFQWPGSVSQCVVQMQRGPCCEKGGEGSMLQETVLQYAYSILMHPRTAATHFFFLSSTSNISTCILCYTHVLLSLSQVIKAKVHQIPISNNLPDPWKLFQLTSCLVRIYFHCSYLVDVTVTVLVLEVGKFQLQVARTQEQAYW